MCGDKNPFLVFSLVFWSFGGEKPLATKALNHQIPRKKIKKKMVKITNGNLSHPRVGVLPQLKILRLMIFIKYFKPQI